MDDFKRAARMKATNPLYIATVRTASFQLAKPLSNQINETKALIKLLPFHETPNEIDIKKAMPSILIQILQLNVIIAIPRSARCKKGTEMSHPCILTNYR